MRISDWSSDVCSSDLDRDLLAVRRGERVELQRVLAHGELFLVGGAGDRSIDVGKGAAAGLLPGPDLGWDIFDAVAHDAFSGDSLTPQAGKFDGTRDRKSTRLNSSH